MLDQGGQEERNHVIWETSIKEQDDNKKERHMLQTIQSPILAFKPPNPPGHKEQKDKGTKYQENQGNKKQGTREIRRKKEERNMVKTSSSQL